MKPISLAVLALLGHVSAVELRNHHRHHRAHHRPHNMGQVRSIKTSERPMYIDTPGGQSWWELDDKHERIEDTEDHRGMHDLDSPYDPDVGDAPEDLPRRGNDHEGHTNAKLSPTGYHNGFAMAKDAFGNYA
mgnify:CR=1 FL=1